MEEKEEIIEYFIHHCTRVFVIVSTQFFLTATEKVPTGKIHVFGSTG